MTDEQRKERMAALEEMLDRDRAGRRKADDDQGYQDSGDAVRARIARDREIQRYRQQKEAERALEEHNLAIEDEIDRAEGEEEEKRWAEEEHLLHDSSAVMEKFEDEFSDVWENESIRQALFDALDLRIGEEGRDPLDYRTYEELGEHFRHRLERIEKDPASERLFQREDQENRIRVKRLREIDQDNLYFNRTLEKPEPQEETVESIQQTFSQEFPDVVADPHSMKDAVVELDEKLRGSAIETGVPQADYETYREAGEHARRRNVLRGLAASRGQNPDEI